MFVKPTIKRLVAFTADKIFRVVLNTDGEYIVQKFAQLKYAPTAEWHSIEVCSTEAIARNSMAEWVAVGDRGSWSPMWSR